LRRRIGSAPLAAILAAGGSIGLRSVPSERSRCDNGPHAAPSPPSQLGGLMARPPNYSQDKKRREEAARKKRDEKQQRRQQKKETPPAPTA
jgi:hypothetical protein